MYAASEWLYGPWLGHNETLQPFGEFVNDGCNLWRNFVDIQCSWDSLSGIIDHWGDWGEALVPAAGPGHCELQLLPTLRSIRASTALKPVCWEQGTIWTCSSSALSRPGGSTTGGGQASAASRWLRSERRWRSGPSRHLRAPPPPPSPFPSELLMLFGR